MADTYTVTINDTTPTLIIDNGVGNYTIPYSGQYFVGTASLGFDSGGHLVNGISAYPSTASLFYVHMTSPDSLYAMLSPGSGTLDLSILHTR